MMMMMKEMYVKEGTLSLAYGRQPVSTDSTDLALERAAVRSLLSGR